jgi:NADH pyrophosphatase NudC (nudix superfamily)
MENEAFKILTKVYKDEISRVEALEKLFVLFNVSQRSGLVCGHCGSKDIDKYGGDGVYCNNCHKEL